MILSPDLPLRTRIRLLAVVPVMAVTMLLTAYFLADRISALGNELDVRGRAMATQLAPAAEYGLLAGNREVLVSLTQPLLAEPDVVYVRVFDAEGQLVVEQGRRIARDSLVDGHLRVYSAPVVRQRVMNEQMVSLASLGPEPGSDRIGRVEIGLVTDGIDAQQRDVLAKALVLSVAVLLLTLLLAARMANVMARIEEARASAEHASRAKSEFLAMMSHELRTPMNGVLGMLELMEDTPLDGDQRQYLETARTSSEHLLVVIDDILDFSRIEGGRLPLEQIEFDLCSLLRATVDGFTYQAALRQIALVQTIDPSLRDVRVVSDPTRLRQVLVNLVGNALKFTERGRVSVRASGTLVADRLSLLIEVEDTGIGIAPERIEQMFEPFHQADSSTSRRYGGTGLGLPIARRLTAMLGGTINVKSGVGQGTCFTLRFELPAHRAMSTDVRKPDTQVVGVMDEARLAGRRVLLVEDNAVSRLVAEGMLRSMGMNVDVVGDGSAALDSLARQRYDVVLMDLQLPVLDGLETTHRIRALPEAGGGRIPIVAVTANVFAGERERCLQAGMNAYIAKPFSRHQLREALLSLVGNQSPSPGR